MTTQARIESLVNGDRGGFARAMGIAWQYADESNRAKIEAAFPNLFEVTE